jgi:hypothetical protein
MGESMPRVRVRIHPTGHLEVQIEGMIDDGCHALVDETASWAGMLVERCALPPDPSRAAVEARRSARRPEGAVRIGPDPSTG